MDKKRCEEAVKLTQECLAHFWQLDPEFVLEYCAPDVIWVGSAQEQYRIGYEETAKDLRGVMDELKPCYLLGQEFFIVGNSGNCCTVVGRYLVTTDDTVEYFLQVQQRCSFVWEYEEKQPRIRHIHVSNPIGEMKLAEGEIFVNQMGKMAKQYMMRRMENMKNQDRIAVTDANRCIHILLVHEIAYVIADGRNSVICTASGEQINARMSIARVIEASENQLYMIHRSYAVNPDYISCLQKNEVIMMDERILAIPKKKFTEVSEKLMEYYNQEI